MTELSLLDTLLGNGAESYMDSLYSAFTAPACDVSETKTSYVIEMDLPGRSENDVELNLKDDVLTISSIKKEEKKENKEKAEDNKFLIKERNVSAFKRSFTLPKNIDAEKISATFANGVLTINIAKKEQAPEKKIQIIAA